MGLGVVSALGWAPNDVLTSTHHVEGLAWRGGSGGRGWHVGVGVAWRGLVWMVPGRNLWDGPGSGSLCWGRAVSGHISRRGSV